MSFPPSSELEPGTVVSEIPQDSLPERTYWQAELISDYDKYPEDQAITRTPELEANLVSSLCESGKHAPALDFDFSAELEEVDPSHSVLTIHKAVSDGPYAHLIDVMEVVGLVPEDHPRETIEDTTAIGFQVPVRLLPSSSSDRYHPYVDNEMSWNEYEAVLTALYSAGLLEEGFYRLGLLRQQTMLRPPGVYKEGALATA